MTALAQGRRAGGSWPRGRWRSGWPRPQKGVTGSRWELDRVCRPPPQPGSSHRVSMRLSSAPDTRGVGGVVATEDRARHEPRLRLVEVDSPARCQSPDEASNDVPKPMGQLGVRWPGRACPHATVGVVHHYLRTGGGGCRLIAEQSTGSPCPSQGGKGVRAGFTSNRH